MSTTALITGASSGIGEQFALQLAKRGYDLVLVARSQDKLERLAAEISAQHGVKTHVIAADLSLPGAALRLHTEAAQLGLRIDLLVNNAGFGLSGEFLNHPIDAYREQIMLNVNALMEMTHLFLADMAARRSGAIINVASLLSFMPFPYCSVYSGTKAFVLSFTESLWEEYRHQGVRVLALCPGPTDTNFFRTASEVETKSKRMPAQVVHTALRALSTNKGFVIDGANNYFTALLGRVLPRATLAKILGAAMRKSIEQRSKS
ncbi:SDR family NAD(P)-dependent oxidoreductase [Paenibacillus xanthanilyticus]|uniref:SDR family NAD(P)-dependent oxidoreductase n=1 Tax=Paenibacillus xanthanilyticus TaxID=1783531 RepID=A0ABV8K7E2_9BACL